ncbi:hypothetical protein BDR26DRAFT_859809, partial [Obelidium mucronatum]
MIVENHSNTNRCLISRMSPVLHRRSFGGSAALEGFGAEKSTPEYDFFTVLEDDGKACQGMFGKLTLYRGATVSLRWSNSVWTGHTPVTLTLFLRDNKSNATALTIADNVPITASTNSFSYQVPVSAPVTNETEYTLTGSYTDAAGKVSFLPADTTNVVVLDPGTPCDHQTPATTPINVPLAAGLGGSTAFLLLLFVVEDKGKFWMDGPRSKHLQKPNLFDRILTRLRPKKKKKLTKKESDDDSDDGSKAESSGDGDESINDAVEEFDNNSKNPFISEQDQVEMRQVSGNGYVIPLKDPDSSESSSSGKQSAKGKGPPTTTKSVSRKSTTHSFGSNLFSKIKSMQEVTPLTTPPVDIGNSVRTMVDPVTGQVKTYVFLDSRGPPDRNVGGSSRWTPPVAVLNQKHRVLTVFNATEPDELTLARGEYVNVETVEDNRYKPEATNSGKKGERNVKKIQSTPKVSGVSEASRASWGARVLRTFVKDDGGVDILGDAATGGQRGVVPYTCLYLVHESYVYRPSNATQAPATAYTPNKEA